MDKLDDRNTIGTREINAAVKVLETGKLSEFIGAWNQDKFFGGHQVKHLESTVCEKFGVKHAISVNSWTSGLITAIAALGLEPGDEVITTPWTMSATAMAILHSNCIPVFADIDPVTFNIDPSCVRRLVTNRTRAVLAVDIFGLSADISALRQICNEHNLKLVSDCAQAPGAKVDESYAGTIADIGGFSFNYHKHIHCGEGGVVVTNDDDLAVKCQLIRNHAESVVGDRNLQHLPNMVGYNFRLTEIESSIAATQLSMLDRAVQEKQSQAKTITNILKDTPGLRLPDIPTGYTHAYYIYGIVLDCSRDPLARELLLEKLGPNFPIIKAYQNIHRLPIFERRKIYSISDLPWCLNDNHQEYGPGTCPVAEDLFDKSFVGIPLCQYELTEDLTIEIATKIKIAWESIYDPD